jgi:uncharacterized protein
MKQLFEMTPTDFEKLLEASNPVLYIITNGVEPVSPLERIMAAWEELGKRMGFDPKTASVADVSHSHLCFMAEPTVPKDGD